MFDCRDMRKLLDLWANICNHSQRVAQVITSINGDGHQARGSAIPQLGVNEEGSYHYGL